MARRPDGQLATNAAAPYDYDRLARRLLQPDRPRLAEVRAALAGVDDPREAWERVAPGGWIGDPRRGFTGDAREAPVGLDEASVAARGDLVTGTIADGRGTRVTLVEVRPEPPTLAAVVTLCSDPGGVATAESLAFEFLARLRPARAPARVVWDVGPPGAMRPLGASPLGALDQLQISDVERDSGAIARNPRGDAVRAARDAASAAMRARMGDREWPALLGLTVPYLIGVDAAWRAVPRRRPDPLAPLIALLEAGYALRGPWGDAVVLQAPAVEP